MKYSWIFGGLLLLGFLFRLPGLFWGAAELRTFTYSHWQPDENQHAEIARLVLPDWDTTYPRDDLAYLVFNARGYGYQLAALAWGIRQLGLAEMNHTQLIFLGRGLSLFYGLLIILFWCGIARQLKLSPAAVYSGGILVAGTDLMVTYSTYAIPEMAYLAWCLIAIYCYLRGNAGYWSWLMAAAGAAGMVLALKMDFVFAAWLIGVSAWSFHRQPGRVAIVGAGMLVMVVGALWASHGGSLTPSSWWETFQGLRERNQDLIVHDHHGWSNPLVYALALLGTFGLGAFLVGISGWWSILRTETSQGWRAIFLLLLLTFGVIWLLDAPFVRRTLLLVPLLALGAAYFLGQWNARGGKWSWAAGGIVVYTLLISLGQRVNVMIDPRYQARDFLLAQADSTGLPETFLSAYATTVGLPEPPGANRDSAMLLVIHEARYGRYGKSFTTPFNPEPACCDEVYHCANEAECQWYQALQQASNGQYALWRTFPTREWAPERVLFKHLLGSYETFLGDVQVWRRKGE